MILSITDGMARAEISTLGAELRSLVMGGRELMWCRDPKFWDGSAMVLFPFIGRCCDDRYLLSGKEYPMGLHGFGWKSEFSVVEQKENSCVLELTDSPDTREIYPFAFTLKVGFFLEEGGLTVRFTVENRSDGPMPFALGWHPGFQLAGPPENYRVRFGADALEEVKIVTRCMVTGEIAPMPLEDGCLVLDRKLFTDSARVFRASGETAVVEDKAGNVLARLRFHGFANVTLWQTLGSGAEFICVEPWLSRPGKFDAVEELGQDEKTVLAPGEVFRREIRVQGPLS